MHLECHLVISSIRDATADTDMTESLGTSSGIQHIVVRECSRLDVHPSALPDYGLRFGRPKMLLRANDMAGIDGP